MKFERYCLHENFCLLFYVASRHPSSLRRDFLLKKIRKIYIEKIEKKIVKKFLKNHKILLTTYSDIDIIKTGGIFALSEVNFKE